MPMIKYVVKQGDCISSIAYSYGFLPDTVWNAPENERLRTHRGENGRILKAGDVVFIPDKRQKEVSASTDAKHRFRRKGVPEILRIQILDVHGEPRPNVAYELDFGFQRRKGQTDGDGVVCEGIPPNLESAKLIVEGDEEADEYEYQLNLGGLDPAEDTAGIQMRLENLGFDTSVIDGPIDSKTNELLRRFQQREGLAETGEFDAPTRDRLKQLYGC